ncbi:GNAT family N-acetyltransferase [Paucilactobacillus kaifaensis]|uniref:GNAT family N-acetyltransferase n=1 Tax=Paucilactobacillus kaifaensis TaxID=2559921 RepID=UPI0010F9FFD9|nr:GNAT family N-acetyltransferase [Paucilactobacillus kaifaensis]
MELIREMVPKDNNTMKSILQQCLRDAQLDKPGTAYFDPQLDELAQYYQQLTRAKYWVAVDQNDQVVGGCGIGPVGTTDVCELQKLYIAPDARGQGLSKRLIKLAIETATKFGYHQMYIVTDTKLPVANKLYQKLQFNQLEQPLDGDIHSGCDTWYLKAL